jgi:hypothetical protein
MGIRPLVGGSLARCLKRGSAPARATAATRSALHPPAGGPAVTHPGDRACKSQPGGPPAPGMLTPRKDHHKGRAQGRVAYSDGPSATLDSDLPRQESAPVGRTAQCRDSVDTKASRTRSESSRAASTAGPKTVCVSPIKSLSKGATRQTPRRSRARSMSGTGSEVQPSATMALQDSGAAEACNPEQ